MAPSPLRVSVSVATQFHAFELAAQLARHHVLHRLVTGDPRAFRRGDIPRSRLRLVPHVFPVQRLPGWLQGSRAANLPWGHWALRTFDAAARFLVGHPDVLVGWSGQGLEAGRAVQAQGGRWVVERGSTHIRFQAATLERETALRGVGERVAPETVALEEAEYAACDLVVVPSGFARRTFIEQGHPEDRVVAIPYGADLSAFRPGQAPTDTFRLVFVGGVSFRKGIGYLLEAWKKLALPRAELLLVGALRPEVRALVAAAGPTVVSTGSLSRNDVAARMRSASAFVLPSLEEGMPLSMLQALASGLPVIVTPNTGAGDVVQDGREGLFVPPTDVDALAAAIARLHGDPALRNEMAAAAAIAGRSRSWDAYGDDVVAAYRALVERPPRHARPGR